MEERSRGLAELLLEGELGEVTLGLEQGLFSWDELELPHDCDGSTPLISACQSGLTMVMHFLLEKGVDATLCNYSNQTALHVSPPDLQGELLAAIVRPLGHRGQFLEAAWRGDINTLQHLLTQTDLVDVNVQNRNGLTPLMLALRDVDVFEGLRDVMPWDYRPVETVKALLTWSASVEVEDHRSFTALHYVSQMKSPIKDDLLRIILEWSSHTGLPHMEPRGCILTDRSARSVSHSPAQSPSTPARVRHAVESHEHSAVQESQVCAQEKIVSLFFQTAMEPKRSDGQGFSQLSTATGWTSSLPNLHDRNKRWDALATLHCTSDALVKKPLIPTPPRLTGKSKTTVEGPAVPQFAHLSQSAPSLALLDASVVLQVRANIYNRLSQGELDHFVNGQKDVPPFLCPRTPKRLAPLDRGLREGLVLPNLQRPLLLKPINILPASPACRQRRERFSRRSLRGSRGTRSGSAESASSSCSSESSLDLDEEDKGRDGNGSLEKQQIFSTLQRELKSTRRFPSSSKYLVNLGTDTTEHVGSSNRDMPMISQFKSQEIESQASKRDSVDKIAETVGTSSNDLNGHMDAGTETRHEVDNGQSISVVDLSPENITVLHPASEAKSKPTTTTKRKAGKCRPFQTDKSFNILAYRNTHWGTVNGKKNRKNSSICSQVKSKDTNLADQTKGETTHWPRMAPTKTPHSPKPKDAPLARRRTPEYPHQVKLGGDKNTLTKCESQKQLLNRELKTARQPKKPGNPGSQRAKSALDSVTYSDMFLQIHEGENGPAIFEMFATPIYENLRVGSSAERAKQVQLAPQVKRPLNEQRSPKAGNGNRRKLPQKCKGKPRKRRDIQPIRPQNLHQPTDRNIDKTVGICGLERNCNMRNHEILTVEDGKKSICGNVENGIVAMLSVIEEVLSSSATGTPSNRSAIRPCDSGQIVGSKSDAQKDVWDGLSKAEDSVEAKVPAGPVISGRTRSPVYQRFLDEVGEGPVTEDLLRCLAEELISLEEKEVETLKPEHTRSKEIITDRSTLKKVLPKGTLSDKLPCMETSSVDDATITWTRGEVLGRGAYGTVYCGLTSQGQLIAVKQVVLDVSTSDTAEKEHDRLQREVDLLKNLDHPNIVGFLGTALTDNVISIFMEYVPGGSIYSILSRFGPLPEKVFALYTRQILEGVAYLHDNSVIHRDLKGNNIMLMPTGVVKLIDFGCARRLNRLTHSGGNSDFLKSVHGTPYWMAPEVINETGHGRKSDIWSVGCTVFEMATGKPPLAHMGKIAALFYIGARKGLMPSLPGDFSEEAKGFVKACLTSNQKQRPSAADLLRHPFIFPLRKPKTNKSASNPHLLAHHTNCSSSQECSF